MKTESITNESMALLGGAVINNALEDLFARPATKAPPKVEDKEQWLKLRNAEIERDRIEALEYIEYGELIVKSGISPKYIVKEFYELNKNELMSLLDIIKRFYRTGYIKARNEMQSKITELEAEVETERKKTAKAIVRDLTANTIPTFDKKGKPILKIKADFGIKTLKKYGVKTVEVEE